MKPNEYKCAMCGNVYQKVMDNRWSDDKALIECKQFFGASGLPDNDERFTIVCDPCFQKIHPLDHPNERISTIAELASEEAERE